MGGPKAAAAPPTADHRPIAAPLRAGPKAGSRRPSEVGNMSAPPLAWRMRAATRSPSDGATAHRADEAVKMPSPSRKAFFRPVRSAQRPAGTSKEAKTMVYALSTHDIERSDSPWKLGEMLGKAMFTMNRSSDDRNTPVSTTSAVRVGRAADGLWVSPRNAVSCVTK
jgi:hypothetical protein